MKKYSLLALLLTVSSLYAAPGNDISLISKVEQASHNEYWGWSQGSFKLKKIFRNICCKAALAYIELSDLENGRYGTLYINNGSISYKPIGRQECKLIADIKFLKKLSLADPQRLDPQELYAIYKNS